MRHVLTLLTLAFTFALLSANVSLAAEYETFQLWPELAPGEKADAPKPFYTYWKPEQKTSDLCVIICPGGAYRFLDGPEPDTIARFFNSKGIAAVVLRYRTPSREGWPKHLAALQDAQRCVRVVRSRAKEWGIDPERIGILGNSAGGHLTLMVATSSMTNSYDPIDELDKLPCNVSFAVPIYPAYVLEDGASGPNANKGNDSEMVADFPFDAQTPPMCLLHGDADEYSPMGSVAVYTKLRRMGVPAELHVYAKIPHGFAGHATDDHVGDWINRVYAWIRKMEF